MGDELLIDAAQILPLPEAADYEVKVRAQAQEIKKVHTARQEILRRFWVQYIDRSRGKTTLAVRCDWRLANDCSSRWRSHTSDP